MEMLDELTNKINQLKEKVGKNPELLVDIKKLQDDLARLRQYLGVREMKQSEIILIKEEDKPLLRCSHEDIEKIVNEKENEKTLMEIPLMATVREDCNCRSVMEIRNHEQELLEYIEQLEDENEELLQDINYDPSDGNRSFDQDETEDPDPLQAGMVKTFCYFVNVNDPYFIGLENQDDLYDDPWDDPLLNDDEMVEPKIEIKDEPIEEFVNVFGQMLGSI